MLGRVGGTGRYSMHGGGAAWGYPGGGMGVAMAMGWYGAMGYGGWGKGQNWQNWQNGSTPSAKTVSFRSKWLKWLKLTGFTANMAISSKTGTFQYTPERITCLFDENAVLAKKCRFSHL